MFLCAKLLKVLHKTDFYSYKHDCRKDFVAPCSARWLYAVYGLVEALACVYFVCIS